MRGRQPTGLKYAACPLRDDAELLEVVCLLLGCRGRSSGKTTLGFVWDSETWNPMSDERIPHLRTEMFPFNSIVQRNKMQVT